MILNFLENFLLHKAEDNKTMITSIIYNYDIDTLKKELYDKLENIKKIKHPKTKRLLNDRFYSLIQYIDKLNKDIQINNIFLINDDIHVYKLSKKDINLLREYNKEKNYIICDNTFKLEHIRDFFTNFNYYHVFACNKLSVKYNNITKTKSKTILHKTCKTENELNTFINDTISNQKYLIYGKSTLLKKYEYPIFNKNLTHDEIINEIENKEMEKNHLKLENAFNLLEDERKMHLVVYGKIKIEIKEAIEEYRIKELYCHEKRLHILKRQASKEYFNFPITIIKKLHDGDISEKLLNDYRGAIGISYY